MKTSGTQTCSSQKSCQSNTPFRPCVLLLFINTLKSSRRCETGGGTTAASRQSENYTPSNGGFQLVPIRGEVLIEIIVFESVKAKLKNDFKSTGLLVPNLLVRRHCWCCKSSRSAPIISCSPEVNCKVFNVGSLICCQQLTLCWLGWGSKWNKEQARVTKTV